MGMLEDDLTEWHRQANQRKRKRRSRVVKGKFVSINAHTIRHNAVAGSRDAPIRIATSRHDAKPTYASEIEIIGPAKLVYNPDKAIMKCGARMVLQCADVRVIR